jgi:hypothetical protein
MRMRPLQQRRRLGARYELLPSKASLPQWMTRQRHSPLLEKETSHSLKITDKTIITRGGQPATMKDVVSNEEVRGSYYKMPDGSMEAKIVKLGP